MAKKKAVQPAMTAAAMLRPKVKKVLLEEAKQPKQPFLTAFQILDKLAPKVRNALIQNHQSPGGDKAYVRYAASQVVKDAVRWLAPEIIFLDTHGIKFTVNGISLKPSSKEQIAAYRLRPVKKTAAKKPKTASTKTSVREAKPESD